MSLSNYFEDLKKSYQAELEDLQENSEGNNVLAARLKDKRSQFSALLPMIHVAPEMVAVAFHGLVNILDLQAMYMLTTTEPDEFPAWSELSSAVHFDPTSKKWVDAVLAEPDGERFMLTVIGLEYLHGKPITHYGDARDDVNNEGDDVGDDASDPTDAERGDGEEDLEVAGADWMAEQGFDRRD